MTKTKKWMKKGLLGASAFFFAAALAAFFGSGSLWAGNIKPLTKNKTPVIQPATTPTTPPKAAPVTPIITVPAQSKVAYRPPKLTLEPAKGRYNGTAEIRGKLLNADGKILENENVTLQVNNKEFQKNVKSGPNGSFAWDFKIPVQLKPGTYPIDAVFKGDKDKNIPASSGKNTLTVFKGSSHISLINAKQPRYEDDKDVWNYPFIKGWLSPNIFDAEVYIKVDPGTFVTSGPLITKASGAFSFTIYAMQEDTGYVVTATFSGNDCYVGTSRSCLFYRKHINQECD